MKATLFCILLVLSGILSAQTIDNPPFKARSGSISNITRIELLQKVHEYTYMLFFVRTGGLKKKEQVTWKMQPPERNISLKVQKVSKSIKKYICLIPVKKTTCLFSNPCLKKLKRSTFSARLIMKGIHTIFP